jgi:isopentenyl diphosphate isomerase/L-lactate dehydrogenase-like FMN-dependent dehydrogenase
VRCRVLELLRDEVELALALCGCTSPEDVGPRHLTRLAT